MGPVRVVLLSDFGTADGYAAAMAGVIASGAPAALVEHASHDVAPGDILGGALTLSRYAALYPPGTIHVAVIDPGVGTGRRALAAAIDDRLYLAPDNGLLSLVLRPASRASIVALGQGGAAERAAPTFHGRDVFAPAAARLAAGEELASLGPHVHDPVLLDLPEPVRAGDGVSGEVIHVDRFGSLITNIPALWTRPADGGGKGVHVRVADRDVGPVQRTYGDVASGELVALIGSLDLLEISVRDGSAAGRLGAERGTAVACLGGR